MVKDVFQQNENIALHPQSLRDAPPFVYHETAVISLGKSAKPKKSFILIKNKPLRIALLFAKV